MPPYWKFDIFSIFVARLMRVNSKNCPMFVRGILNLKSISRNK